ncbi:uncharacterized protein LOC101845163 [Aplysia californica]|uniref:Uncharacterized protein LOC101845163 n=1 Tax=Aplysia californica TaxID=6500 RepID=A0ABM0JLK9_APLCA|nr:uncharacterized protein LOC101845163 [Aplysia californica]XP_005096559.1 uncharacterized protein LOC101845163 [Aplysia californica]XP_005096560.1 uncharacterized protein LOC101845163 [Aplysia californica]
MEMAGCEVCWTCRGLIFGDSSGIIPAFEQHALMCRGPDVEEHQTSFDYFVCDKADYFALKNLKKNFAKTQKSIKSKLWATLPSEVVECIFDLCIPENGNAEKESSSYFPMDQKSKCSQTKIFSGPVLMNQDNISTVDVTICQSENDNTVHFENRSNICNGSGANGNEKILKNQEESFHDQLCINTHTLLLKEEEEKLTTECILTKEGNFTNYCCKLCQHQTKSDRLMLRHLNAHDNGQAFKCVKCDFSTMWRSEWNQHCKKCLDQKSFLCQFCGEEFTRRDKFNKHCASAHSDGDPTALQLKNKLQCEQCDYIGRSLTCLKEHKKKHTGEMIFCPHEGCDFKSFYRRSLTKHLNQKHAKEKNLICSVCGFQTRHMSSLTKHMKLHRSLKKFKCVQCTFTAFTSSQVLDHVRRKHLKEKLYSCPKCPFQTGYPMGIKKHIQRHEGVFGYSCSICGESVGTMRKAKEHMVHRHGCTDYRVLNESIEKIKPRDYQIKNRENIIKEPMKYVVMITNEQVSNDTLDMEILDVDLNSNDVLEMATDILSGESQQISSSEGLLDPTLHANPTSMNHVKELFESQTSSEKGRNPMLSATSNDLGDAENSLIEDSLFDLMTDFPRPSNLNRCQSASTLMFTSFSPHLVDRPLTPDFFSDSPSAGSFFPNFTSKALETDTLPLGHLSSFDGSHQEQHADSNSRVLTKAANPPSPILSNFMTSSIATNSNSLHPVVNMSEALLQTSVCENLDSILPSAVFGTPCPPQKMHGSQISFSSSSSAFTALTDEYSTDLQNAVASIAEATALEDQVEADANDESPFPLNSVM